jgi:parallel beta-helix repeat protein
MGITIYKVTNENKKNITIYDNRFFQNQASGILVYESSGLQIYRNLFEDNGGTWDYGWYAGIHLYQSSQVIIQKNTIISLKDNQFGLLFRGYSNYIQIIDNDICVGKPGNSIIDYYFCNSCVYSKNTYCKRQPHSIRDLTMIYRLLLFN